MSTVGKVHVEARGLGEIRRTQIVWATFVCAMTIACGVLLLADGSMPALRGGPMLGPAEMLGASSSPAAGVFDISRSLDHDRWKTIVIHHSNTPAGDPAQLDRYHRGLGLQGLGYHFVIGNGNGLDDGMLHVGHRWDEQRPGAVAIGAERDWQNRHSIAICLIGNGNTRPFTDRQMESLTTLVARLQAQFGISADHVRLLRDLDPRVHSPGRFFKESELRDRLRSVGAPD